MPMIDPVADGVASTACPICASEAEPERYGLREMLFGSREVFGYLRCPACGALRIIEVPADLARHYPPDYYSGPTWVPTPPYAQMRRLRRRAGSARDRTLLTGAGALEARLLARWVPKVPPDVRRQAVFTQRAGLTSFDDPILDVGCGMRPTSLAKLQAVGFRHLLGIDPFLDADHDIAGVPVRRESIHEVAGTFQAITFHHSFEHVPDPQATLTAAAARLRPGGVILIRTPVMGGWFWEQFGTAWWELDAPRHLWVHTQSSLERLARQAGLELIDVVWDSSYVEVIASDQIGRDIAWHEPASWNIHPPAGYDDATIASYKTTVAELNASGRAGRAGFYFRRPSDPARRSAS